MLERVPPYLRERFRLAHPSMPGITTNCWSWTASCTESGYGRVDWKGYRHRMAHRVMYALLIGPIPEGLTLDHLCRNRCCVNPAHLEPVTLKENLARGFGVGAINKAKTHCRRGHDLGEGNHYVYGGKRYCKRCQSLRQKAYLERKERGMTRKLPF